MHISGQALSPPKPAEIRPKSPRKQEKLRKSSEPKVRFLSTWESSSKIGPQSTQHRSIHHFCMEPSLPQLPIHLQVASRQAHVKPIEVEGGDMVLDKTVDGDSDKSEEIHKRNRDLSDAKVYPLPNTPYTATRTTSMPIARGKTPVISQDNERAAKKVLSKHSEGPRTISRSKRDDEDNIVERAKSQLSKELRGEVKPPSSAKSREKRVKKKATPHIEVGEGEQMMLGGSRMTVTQDPAK